MDAFSYTDIFDTKGIEYIIVIGFLLLLIPTWIWLNKPVNKGDELMKAINGLSFSLLKIPRGLFYTKNHTWTFLEKSGVAKIGLDDLILHMTGGVSVDYLINEKEIVKKGDIIAAISKGDKKMNIVSPISGEMNLLNRKLSGNEGMINQDPYENGWICKMKPANWQKEVSQYKLDEEAIHWEQKELTRCKDFIANIFKEINTTNKHLVLQEGGELIDFPLSEMSEEVWKKFQKEFLD